MRPYALRVQRAAGVRWRRRSWPRSRASRRFEPWRSGGAPGAYTNRTRLWSPAAGGLFWGRSTRGESRHGHRRRRDLRARRGPRGPMFWLQTEDHDFAEIARPSWWTRGEVERVALRRWRSGSRPVSLAHLTFVPRSRCSRCARRRAGGNPEGRPWWSAWRAYREAPEWLRRSPGCSPICSPRTGSSFSIRGGKVAGVRRSTAGL